MKFNINVDNFNRNLIKSVEQFYMVWEEELMYLLGNRPDDDDRPLVEILCFEVTEVRFN